MSLSDSRREERKAIDQGGVFDAVGKKVIREIPNVLRDVFGTEAKDSFVLVG